MPAEMSELGIQLKPVVSLHLEQQEANDENAARLAELLQNYNQYIATVSQKFIYYEQLINSFEQQVSQ